MPVTQTGPLSQVNMAVVRQCAATFIELVKKVSFLNKFDADTSGRIAGYGDLNDADRLGRDPAMRWIVGGRAATKQAASTSQMGRFETERLGHQEDLPRVCGSFLLVVCRCGRRP